MAVSQIKAAELEFFLHLELLQFLLFAPSLSETGVIQTEGPENFVVIFEILLINKE